MVLLSGHVFCGFGADLRSTRYFMSRAAVLWRNYFLGPNSGIRVLCSVEGCSKNLEDFVKMNCGRGLLLILCGGKNVCVRCELY